MLRPLPPKSTSVRITERIAVILIVNCAQITSEYLAGNLERVLRTTSARSSTAKEPQQVQHKLEVSSCDNTLTRKAASWYIETLSVHQVDNDLSSCARGGGGLYRCEGGS